MMTLATAAQMLLCRGCYCQAHAIRHHFVPAPCFLHVQWPMTRRAFLQEVYMDGHMDTDMSRQPTPGSAASHGGAERSHSEHIAHPACPAPWTPFSPSTWHLVSPQYAHAHRIAPKDAHAMQSRQFLSAQPLQTSGQQNTPLGTSPPQHAAYVAAQQQKIAAAVHHSPRHAQPRLSSQMVSMPFASPAVSESSSHMGMQMSPCMTRQLSPRRTDTEAVNIPGKAACHLQDHAGVHPGFVHLPTPSSLRMTGYAAFVCHRMDYAYRSCCMLLVVSLTQAQISLLTKLCGLSCR